MELNPSEIQILASLDNALLKNSPTDLDSLEHAAKWYWVFLEDDARACERLAGKGLINGDGHNIRLTAPGSVLAREYNREKPDLYWHFYQKFLPAALASEAHSRFCEKVFGKDLCQDGQVDMAGLEHLLNCLKLSSSDHLLDIGCGSGAIASYIAEQTGARVTGLDFAHAAIAEAKARTEGKSDRLSYLQGDINAFDFPAATFDAVISIDSLYWVSDLAGTLLRISQMIKPGGQMGIFMEQSLEDGDPAEILQAANTDLARALGKLGFAHVTYDYSQQNIAFWRRIRDTTREMRDEFEAEGNGFIAASFQRQADEFLPGMEAGETTRYFYHVRL